MRGRATRMPGEWPVGWPLAAGGRLLSLATVPICAYIGYNGMGKSALAAAVAMSHAEAGRPVLSTARLLDWNNPRPCADVLCEWPSHGEDGHLAAHPMWRPLTDYRQLFTFRDGHIWADEATGIADARNHASMPGEVADFLPRMRAAQVTFHWTTIHWSFADTRLRRLTWAAVWATGLMPRYYGDEIWGRNRLFYYRAYDAKNLSDDFDLTKRHSAQSSMSDVRAMLRGWVWGPAWNAWQAYDSLDGVSSLGGTDESGMCMVCGGARGKKRCAGHGPDGEALPARSRRRGRDRDEVSATTPEWLQDGAPSDPRQGVPTVAVPGGDDDRAGDGDPFAGLHVRDGADVGLPEAGGRRRRRPRRADVLAADGAGVPGLREPADGEVPDGEVVGL